MEQNTCSAVDLKERSIARSILCHNSIVYLPNFGSSIVKSDKDSSLISSTSLTWNSQQNTWTSACLETYIKTNNCTKPDNRFSLVRRTGIIVCQTACLEPTTAPTMLHCTPCSFKKHPNTYFLKFLSYPF